MTALDWVIVAVTALLAVAGFARGFVAGALALLGFGIGAVLGSRLATVLLDQGSASPYASLFGLVGAVLLGGLLAGALEGVGARAAERMGNALGAFDGLLGAGLAAALGLALAWIAGAAAVTLPAASGVRGDVQRSEILQRLNDVLPPSGPILNALARFDPLPQVDGPTPDVPEPRQGIATDADVEAAADSVVKVQGTACGLGVEGSGWVAAPGTVVTNAHVVAGQDDTTVQAGGEGPRFDAQAVAFDVRNDVAVLSVPGLGAEALPLAQDPESGASAAILGFPRNGPYDVRAGRLGQTEVVLAQNAYGQGPVRRRIAALRGLVRPGNSGGPMVDARGRVVTTIFAATIEEDLRGGYGVPNAIVEERLAGASGPVDTGPCVR